MRFLLTNDDGIDAPGLASLAQSVQNVLGSTAEIIVVAPHRGRSECSHSVTTGRPLLVKEVQPNWFSVDGTPVDCVRAGLASLSIDVDAVLSGVNEGANVGVDLWISGTFAAAREAAIHQIPAMAISHYRRPDIPRTWDHVPKWLGGTIGEFCDDVRSRKGSQPIWNVNLPAIDPSSDPLGCVRCRVDSKPMIRQVVKQSSGISSDISLSLKSDFHGRPRQIGTDVDRCFAGYTTISVVYPTIQ